MLRLSSVVVFACWLTTLAGSQCKNITLELNPLPPGVMNVTMADVVVSNTDLKLCLTDKFGDSEPSIAIDPENPEHIAITSFSGAWSPKENAPLWYSANAGVTWTKYFTIPVPPKVPGAYGCPCDQTIDYGHDGRLTGSFLASPLGGLHGQEELPGDIYSGTTTDPTTSTLVLGRSSGGLAVLQITFHSCQ